MEKRLDKSVEWLDEQRQIGVSRAEVKFFLLHFSLLGLQDRDEMR